MKKYFIPRESKIKFTQDGYDKLLAEQKSLNYERPDAVENLRKAREMGDLSENGYYKAARARLSFLDGRLRRLERLIKRAEIIETAHSGSVDIGSTVTVEKGGNRIVYKIVGGYESDPQKNTVSHMSPIGKALMGRRAGETAEVDAPAGKIQYAIIDIK